MNVWALIAVKQRQFGKTRLAGRLKDGQRLALVREMLAHVIDIVSRSPCIHGVAVLSPERDRLSATVEVLPELGRDLNDSLALASDVLRRRGAERILVLPADLPWLQVDDIGALVAATSADTVAIAPDEREQGTNALCFPAELKLYFCFGDDSFHGHCRSVRQLGLSTQAVRRSGLAFDLDDPSDLDVHLRHRTGLYTAAPRSGHEPGSYPL